jgi:uncharacterized protein (TIRG00374 family)
VHLQRKYGYSIGALIACQLVEKVVDSLGLGLETLVVALFLPLPAALARSLFTFSILTAAGLVAVVALAWAHGRKEARAARAQVSPGPARTGRVRELLHRLSEGMYLLGRARTLVPSLLWSVVNDGGNALTVGLVLMALGVTLPIGAWFILVLVARLAGLVPSTPGQFGVVEAGMVVTMGAFHVPVDRALAVAVLYHLAHFVPVTVIGLLQVRREWVKEAR